jgi:WD40 repeat protein
MKNRYQRLVHILIALTVGHVAHAGIFESKNSVASEVATIHDTNSIDSLAFSPDGSLLVAAKYSYAHSAQVWNWGQSRRVGPEFKHGNLDPLNANALQFSVDGENAIWCGNVAAVWRVSDGVETYRQKAKPGENSCTAVAYAPSGDTVWMSQMSFARRVHTLVAYDTRTWQLIWKLESPNFFPSAFSLSFDGNFAAIAGRLYSDEKDSQGALISTLRIRVFDLPGRRQIRDFPSFSGEMGLPRSEIAALAWTADGKSLAVGFRGLANDGADAIQILDGATGEILGREPGPKGTRVRGLRFTSDGKYLIVAGISKSVKIWDGKHTKLLQEISAEPSSIAVSQDGHYLALGGGAFGLGSFNGLLGLVAPSEGRAIIYEFK